MLRHIGLFIAVFCLLYVSISINNRKLTDSHFGKLFAIQIKSHELTASSLNLLDSLRGDNLKRYMEQDGDSIAFYRSKQTIIVICKHIMYQDKIFNSCLDSLVAEATK